MKNKKILVALLAMVVTMSMVLSSCGSPKTIEEYYEKDSDFQSEMQKLEDENKGLHLEFDDNTVTYNYDIVEAGLATQDQATSDTMKSSLQQALDGASSTFTSLIKSIEDETEITGVKMVVNYMAGDTLLASSTFENN